MRHGRMMMPVLGILLCLVSSPAALAEASGPTVVVERLHAALLQVMRTAGQLGYAGRLKTLSPVLEAVYDYPNMTRSASGSYWKQFTPNQQTQVTKAFADMSAATYAARFDDYGGETFVTVATKEAPGGGTLVQTQLQRVKGEPVKLDYLLKQSGGADWRIVDVYYMGGISEVANQRSQFLSVLKTTSPEQLAATLEQKAQQMAAGK
mgnify:CR=1 FL=1